MGKVLVAVVEVAVIQGTCTPAFHMLCSGRRIEPVQSQVVGIACAVLVTARKAARVMRYFFIN
jgi:hypothetical protein